MAFTQKLISANNVLLAVHQTAQQYLNLARGDGQTKFSARSSATTCYLILESHELGIETTFGQEVHMHKKSS
jgi:hypothetical protein